MQDGIAPTCSFSNTIFDLFVIQNGVSFTMGQPLLLSLFKY
jgi:hypothetical protein